MFTSLHLSYLPLKGTRLGGGAQGGYLPNTPLKWSMCAFTLCADAAAVLHLFPLYDVTVFPYRVAERCHVSVVLRHSVALCLSFCSNTVCAGPLGSLTHHIHPNVVVVTCVSLNDDGGEMNCEA